MQTDLARPTFGGFVLWLSQVGKMSGEIRREHDEQIRALQHHMTIPGAPAQH